MTIFLECELVLHDYVFFATREIGRLYETGRTIHNYALSYALGFACSDYFCSEQTPKYREHLTELNKQGIYVTPASGEKILFSLSTWKYASNHYHVEMEKAQTNTPSFGRAKELAPESTFRFFIISERESCSLPSWIRLGKWLSKAQIKVRRHRQGKLYKDGEFQTTAILNPLDVPTECVLQRCDV